MSGMGDPNLPVMLARRALEGGQGAGEDLDVVPRAAKKAVSQASTATIAWLASSRPLPGMVRRRGGNSRLFSDLSPGSVPILSVARSIL